MDDLRARLGRVIVASRPDGSPVTADDIGAAGAMRMLLKDALLPNLVQTAEGGPAIVHGGPFANIAHGCNSALATRLGLARGEIVVTEAGFSFDLGGVKFLDVKCRAAGLWPDAVMMVVTMRALRAHGMGNLEHQLALVTRFGLSAAVCLNRFPDDDPAEVGALARFCHARGVPFAPCDGFARGGAGAEEIADAVVAALSPGEPRDLYALDAPYAEKLATLATVAFGAEGVEVIGAAEKQIAALPHGLPVVVAKTHLTLRDDPHGTGPWRLKVRELRHFAGAGFVVALAGDIRTMPGLPKRPTAEQMT
jgi:formate--tetrahydrofolate ligase